MSDNAKAIDAIFLKNGFKKGAEILLAHKDEINALNVFPVPDGDTGHNMCACVVEACKELDQLEFESIKTVSDAIKNGTLMGARGNSGVILSQIFAGFCDVVSKSEVINIGVFVAAMQRASTVAKSAVMKPVRGTILTLIEELAAYCKRHENDFIDFKNLLERLTKRSFKVVDMTREMMPKLKQAGVVDAGAKGLAYIMEGFYKYAMGDRDVEITTVVKEETGETTMGISLEDLKFKYCTEFMVRLYGGVEVADINTLKKNITPLGDSMVIVNSDSILKGHIHTNNPGIVFEEAIKLGELIKVKVDNMKDQHEEIILNQNSNKPQAEEMHKEQTTEEEMPIAMPSSIDSPVESEFTAAEENNTKKYAFVAISPGEGITAVLKEMNVDRIVAGGQTMNPSTADIAVAIDELNAENVYILPNNSNIILAAESAARMTETENKKVKVIPSKSVQTGIAALIGFIDTESPENNFENMNIAMKDVVSISVTHAVRDSEMDNQKIIEGEFLFFSDKVLKSHGMSINDVILEGLGKTATEDYEILTIFYGKDVSEETAENLKELLEERYEDIEVSVYYGGQPHYPYYMSLE